jgi:cytochrome b561
MTIPARYTKVAMALHWLIAAMILANLALPTVWENFAPDELVRPMINLHKSFGITLLGLVLLRILWRMTHKPPAFPEHYPRWERRLANITHKLLYVLMLGVPAVGWMMDSAWDKASQFPMHLFGLFEFPRIGAIMALDPATKERLHSLFEEAHSLSGYSLLALIGLHLAGALKHQFIDRERELQRMLP